MLQFILIFLTIFSLSFAAILEPTKEIQASGNVIDLMLYKDKLIAATDAGTLEVYDSETYEKLWNVQFNDIKDFMGDTIHPKVFSVDYDEASDAYIGVVQASNGSRELLHVKGLEQRVLIDKSQKLYISKAKFVDENRVLLGLLSNEVILFDITQQKMLYRFQINFSHFSDLVLNENKTLAINACEAGELSLINIEKGQISKILKGGNVDNVYKTDIKNGFALGAGQDRRGVVYNIANGTFKRFDAPFLIYSGALSPSAKLAAFAFNEQNDIAIFDLSKSKQIHLLKGQKSTLNSIVFKNENELFSGSDDKFIMKWSLP